MSRGKEKKMINDSVKKEALMRLKKIEGQIRGVMRMVDDEKYCIDIIDQIYRHHRPDHRRGKGSGWRRADYHEAAC